MQINPSSPLPPVGRCIYCGTTSGHLTREHIIPRMLGGNITLPKASCASCQKVTTRIEGYAGRCIFQDVRLKHGFKIKERPDHLPMFEEGASPAQEKVTPILVPTKHAPGALILLQPEPPGVLTGKSFGASFSGRLWFHQIEDGVNDTNEVRKEMGFPSKIRRELNINYMGRLIAKIALGFAVAACGVDGFRSTVSDVILRDEGDWQYWIGGTTAEMDEFPPPSGGITLHRVTVYKTEINGLYYVAVQMQLISYIGTPIYTAIVGELNETGINKLSAAH